MFGEKWFTRDVIVGEGKPDAKGDAAKGVAVGGLNVVIIAVTGAILLTILVWIIATSGVVTTSMPSPKALVFVVQGLKGTTFYNAVMQGTMGPNMQALANSGNYAVCQDVDDVRCAKAQDGYRLGNPYRWQAAPGIASILTGVNVEKHRVANNSFDEIMNFVTTSQKYPTVLSRLKAAGFRTGTVGAGALITSIGSTGLCTDYGVADFECGAATYQMCLATASCNLDSRVPVMPTTSVTDTVSASVQVAHPPTGTVTANVYSIAQSALTMMDADVDAIFVQFPQLEVAARSPGGSYSLNNTKMTAQLYLIDAVIGEIVGLLSQRMQSANENWLIIGVSDHGGSGSTSGTTAVQDELVTLFASAQTIGGTLTLSQPSQPVRQMDVAPTLLRWFGVLDNATSANLDGHVQFICSSGSAATNCTTDVATVYQAGSGGSGV